MEYCSGLFSHALQLFFKQQIRDGSKNSICGNVDDNSDLFTCGIVIIGVFNVFTLMRSIVGIVHFSGMYLDTA